MAPTSEPETVDRSEVAPHTVADWIDHAAARLAGAELHHGHGTDDPLDEAAVLVMHAVGLEHDAPDEAFAATVAPEAAARIDALVGRRIVERIPTAYLVGEAWFAGLRFAVDPRVLVPRSPIAELIERGFAPWIDPERVHRALDLCTGSGCIAIACAVAFPEARVDATDLSADALEVAARNVAAHALGERVALHRGDLWADCTPGYDLIVANPPYVDAEEMAALPPEHRHEPALALASGADGLEHARRILREAAGWLNPGGLLCCEVGGSADALEAAFPTVPFTWASFERGGDGVLLMTREELQAQTAAFAG